MASELRIKDLWLKNIRGIASSNISFEGDLTVLVGNNGVGKTTILESVRASWSMVSRRGRYRSNVIGLGGNCLRNEDEKAAITLGVSDKSGGRYGLSFSVNENGSLAYDTQSVKENAFLNEIAGKDIPLVIYYGQERGFSASKRVALPNPVSVSDKLGIRNSSLDTRTQSIPEFISWFDQKDMDEAREIRDRSDLTYRDPELENIRKIATEISDFSAISLREGSLKLRKDSIDVDIDQLSSGERVYFVLAIDLARRLMIANSTSKLSECLGLVLIDEIDLHLHPNWQHEVLRRLVDTFPRCQFIVTTHSPQVVGGVNSRNIRILERNRDGSVAASIPRAARGRDANYILEGLFLSSERDPEIDDLFDHLDSALETGDFSVAESLIQELRSLVEGSSAEISVREAKLKRIKGK